RQLESRAGAFSSLPTLLMLPICKDTLRAPVQASSTWQECEFPPGALRARNVNGFDHSILDDQANLVGVAFELRGVHGVGPGRHGAEVAWDFGAHAVADRRFASRQRADEETHFLVAHFHVR